MEARTEAETELRIDPISKHLHFFLNLAISLDSLFGRAQAKTEFVVDRTSWGRNPAGAKTENDTYTSGVWRDHPSEHRHGVLRWVTYSSTPWDYNGLAAKPIMEHLISEIL